MASETIIKFDNVSYRYDNEDGELLPLVLKNISLELRAGEVLAVLGHNGSGKSTVARLCNGMAVPESGKVTVAGMDTADESLDLEIRKTVGLVMQDPDNQIVATVVEEDVAFGPENLGIPNPELRERVDAALKAVDMYDLRSAEPSRLSGGQKQRVAIAGVIAMRTRAVVMDEPTAMLDPKGREEVMSTVFRLRDEYGIGVMLITHYMEEAARADRIIVMDHGTVALEGAPSEVFKNEKELISLGLDIPQSAKLASALRTAGVALPEGIITPAGLISAYGKEPNN